MTRTLATVAGALLVLASPAVGILHGPGGVFVFAAGVALLLRGSTGAKRLYVRVKRRWPRVGGWVDWGLRRHRGRAPAPR